MKRSVLNVSIDTNTPEGERLRDLVLGGDNKNGWVCVTWVDRIKYNPVELLRDSESHREQAVEQCEKMASWIEKARDLMVYYNLYDKPSSAIMLDDVTKKFSDLIGEAPI